MHMRDTTRATMRLFGRLLAEDLHALGDADTDAEARMWALRARKLLRTLDEMDLINGDEAYDRKLTELAQAPGEVWLQIAEEGRLDETDYIAHVVDHFNVGGYPGAPWVVDQLQAIAKADKQNRGLLAGPLPEYVGLMRAATEVTGGLDRLVAVLDRR